MIKRKTILIISIIGMIVSFPPQWYPLALKVQMTSWFGASDYNPLPQSKSPGRAGLHCCETRWIKNSFATQRGL